MFLDSLDTLWTCSWSSNGKVLGASGEDRVIRLYSAGTNGLVLRNELKGAHTKTIRSISFCPRRMRLSAASFDGTVSIWTGSKSWNGDITKWTCSATLEGHENEVKSSGWGVFLNDQAEEDQVFLATCGRDKTVWIWAMEECDSDEEEKGEDDFECLAVLQEHEQDVKCLTWHPNRPLFLTGSYDESILAFGPINSSLDDWIAIGKVAKGLDATIWSLAFSPDGNKLAAALSNGQLILYTLPENWKSFDEWTSKTIQIFKPIPIENGSEIPGDCGDGEGCCSSNKTEDYSCCKSSEVHESSEEEDSGCCGNNTDSSCCSSSKKPRTASLVQIPPAELYNISWNSNSTLLTLACSDHSIKIVNDQGGVVGNVEDAHGGEVNSVSWSPVDENVFASTGDDGKLKVWRIVS